MRPPPALEDKVISVGDAQMLMGNVLEMMYSKR